MSLDHAWLALGHPAGHCRDWFGFSSCCLARLDLGGLCLALFGLVGSSVWCPGGGSGWGHGPLAQLAGALDGELASLILQCFLDGAENPRSWVRWEGEEIG